MADNQNPIVIDDDLDDPHMLQDAMDIDEDIPDDYEDIDLEAEEEYWENFPDQHEFQVDKRPSDVCRDHVKSVFPDICLTYLEQIVSENNYNSDATIGAILDRQEKDGKYPVRDRKRKRTEDDDGEVESDDDDDDDDGDKDEAKKTKNRIIRATKKKLEQVDYLSGTVTHKGYIEMAKNVLASDFPRVPMPTIKTLLRDNRGSVFETHAKLDDAVRNWDDASPPWTEKQRCSKMMINFLPDRIHTLDMTDFDPGQKAAIAELRAARELKWLKDAEAAQETAEKGNFAHAKLIGEVVECGCCFEECALNRMVHCDGKNIHWFCRNCMKMQAETNIGISKYEISCMSVDGCDAGFSADQMKLFLDKKLRVVLERLEQEAMLRMAGIENLETCPFCPYAAECPPIEVDKEFTCINPGCEKVSCRLCHKETHIPKTCAEASKDHGLDARHVLEEAMSEALIRHCNKCQAPYLKLNGCNKIYCTKCSTMQCYVCRQTITSYAHFDDARRGGKSGQCPLFDKTEERHEREVQQAEKEVRQKMLQDNADITEEVLQINLSEKVRQDDQKRKKENQLRQQQQQQQHLNPAAHANHMDMDIVNRAIEHARQFHQRVQNHYPMHPAVPPPPYPHMHPLAPPPPPPPQPIDVPGGPQARDIDPGVVVPLMPMHDQRLQQENLLQQRERLLQQRERLQQQRRHLQQFQRMQMDIIRGREPPQGMVRGRYAPRGVAPNAPMHPPQNQQEAMQNQPENRLNLAAGRQHEPQVLQQDVPNNPPQDGPAEGVDPLYQPAEQGNGFLNLQNPNGFNFRRWGF